ncbi:MAG: helix-turn-helix transcriptional regulator [Candidatus Omnitrophica bacterium]|nr:helix-turn-helix transcriptional regulator [Candidatus Omnitrophota bacterium]
MTTEVNVVTKNISNIMSMVEKSWSQQKLAQEAGLSFNAITKIEQGLAKYPTLKTLSKLSNVFQIGIDELVGRGKTNFIRIKNGKL